MISPSEGPMAEKTHFTRYLEISKREIRIFSFIHLNFEWKHSNLRWRLSLRWIKIIDDYKMIVKMLWTLVQVNVPLMSYINEIPISWQYYKKKLYDFLFTVTLRPFIKYTHPPCFPSHNITKNAETHPRPILDIIFELTLQVSLNDFLDSKSWKTERPIFGVNFHVDLRAECNLKKKSWK